MMGKLLKIYDDKIEYVRLIVDSIFQLSMIIMIFSIGKDDVYIQTHFYKLFASIFMSFGLWSFALKKATTKKVIIELVAKFFIMLVAALIIAKSTGEVKISGLESIIFLGFIAIIYLVANRKSKWNNNLYCSSKEYLEINFGRTVSIVPQIIQFFSIIVPGIFNLDVKMFVASIVIGFISEQIFVTVVMKKSNRKIS